MKKSIVIGFSLFLFTAAFTQQLTYYIPSGPGKETENFGSERSFVFYVNPEASALDDQIRDIDIKSLRRHKFGEEVSARLHLLDKNYTYLTQAAPGSFSGKLIVKKPGIYNSVYKLEKYLKKQTAKDLISLDKGAEELSRYIEIALVLINESCSEFEQALENADSEQDILLLFNQVKFKPY